MTAEHLTFRQIEAYVAKRLPEEQIPAFHEHAENCRACRELLVATVVGSGASHLTEQQAVDFAADLMGADDRILAARHLESCAPCAAMVSDLVDFRESGEADLPAPAQTWRRTLKWALPVAAGIFALAGVSAWLAVRPGHGDPVPPRIVAQLKDANGTLRIGEAGVLMAGVSLPAGSAELVGESLRSGRLPPGPPDLVNGPHETLRSAAPNSSKLELKIISPDAQRLVSDRPEFRWSVVEGASSYDVTVLDESFNVVMRSGALRETAWIPEKALPRTTRLLWQVATTRNGTRITAPAPPEPVAQFEIVGGDDARRIDEAKMAQPPSHLLLAILYAKAGLRREASVELDAVASLNPGSALAESLKQSVARTDVTR